MTKMATTTTTENQTPALAASVEEQPTEMDERVRCVHCRYVFKNEAAWKAQSHLCIRTYQAFETIQLVRAMYNFKYMN